MGATVKAREVEAEQLRELLDCALRELDGDERAAPLLRAAGLEIRIEITDLDLILRVATDKRPGRCLRWSFADAADAPKLDLRMDSDTANAYLQGRESLAIAIARGRVSVSGGSRAALVYLPALRLVVEPYRALVRERYPHLALS